MPNKGTFDPQLIPLAWFDDSSYWMGAFSTELWNPIAVAENRYPTSENITASGTYGVTKTQNVANSPTSTFTADRITEDTANTNHQLEDINLTSISGDTWYTQSVYVKRDVGTRNFALYLLDNQTDDGSAWFDLSNGHITWVGGTARGVVAGVEPAANGYYRCWVAFLSNASASLIANNLKMMVTAVNSYVGDGTSSLLLWGQQLNEGVGPYDYIATGVVSTVGYVKVWNGLGWDLKPVKVWNGSAWQIKPAKFYNGSAWVAA